MMFERSFGRPDVARRIEAAGEQAIASGTGAPEIGGSENSESPTSAVIDAQSGATA